MPALYVLAHGALIRGRKIHVPTGVTVHFYALPGERAYFSTFLYLLAGATMQPARSVTGPKWIDDTELFPLEREGYDWAKALADTNGLSLHGPGHDDAPPSLCTKPYDDHGAPFVGPDDDACTEDNHTCDGYLARSREGTEIHLGACQGSQDLTAALSTAARQILSWFPGNKRLQELARTLFAEPGSTPGIMIVGDEEVPYRDPNQDHYGFEWETEADRFEQLAAMDKHAAWQKFLSYPTNVRYLLMCSPSFRAAVGSAQKEVVQPRDGGWIRLDDLAALRGVKVEELRCELLASCKQPLAPPRGGFQRTLCDSRSAGAQGQGAASWLAIFRNWLLTPGGREASGIDGKVAADLIDWLLRDELMPVRSPDLMNPRGTLWPLLDFSESLQDDRHPVATLFPDHAPALTFLLESYVELEQWLAKAKLCEGLTLFDGLESPEVDAQTDLHTVSALIEQFHQHQAHLDDQLAHTDPDHSFDISIVHQEMAILSSCTARAEETLGVLSQVRELLDRAEEAATVLYYDAKSMLEAPYTAFCDVTLGWEDVIPS
ncbi:hypothetical protein ACFQ78_38645 [Streptomyces sp. NPDC056519]|uniref:hypothetical protein n=1 Tax=Streptomyces sp. NPDC056519 TaxID=3345849 RepID=UPI00367DFF00